MFSMPPAIASVATPAAISVAAVAIACAPEPHTRFTASAGTETGTPPPTDACRAGFMRLPAWITLPNTTESIDAGSSALPARRSVSAMAAAPRSTAGVSFSAPLNAPIAVRTG